MKTCINCKIEYTPSLNNKDFCDYICKKAHSQKWLKKLYKNQGEFLKELVAKDLQSNY